MPDRTLLSLSRRHPDPTSSPSSRNNQRQNLASPRRPRSQNPNPSYPSTTKACPINAYASPLPNPPKTLPQLPPQLTPSSFGSRRSRLSSSPPSPPVSNNTTSSSTYELPPMLRIVLTWFRPPSPITGSSPSSFAPHRSCSSPGRCLRHPDGLRRPRAPPRPPPDFPKLRRIALTPSPSSPTTGAAAPPSPESPPSSPSVTAVRCKLELPSTIRSRMYAVD